MAKDPSKHQYMPWMPLYNLCRGPLPTERLKKIVSDGDFLYFSDNGDIEHPDRPGVQMAVVVVHGAARNADEYFCSMLEAARLQSQFPRDSVAVYAPWFTEPQDSPPEGVVYWNGADPDGVWRRGEESEPTATPSGETVSSYSVLDRMLAALNDTHTYPKLRQVTLVGHSSGGQTVHRYALTQRARHLGRGLARTFRYVVSNPSSYCYLDARRWIGGSLVVPAQARIENCSKYNEWEWGLDGGFPLYVADGPDIDTHVKNYQHQRVVYLIGQNDTCNEALEPGCHSHGLEVTCMDMLEGRFRLERAQLYFKFLREFYNLPIHNFTLVPNVGHDHTLIFQSKQGLDTIFSPEALGVAADKGLKSAANITLALLATCVLLVVLIGLYRNLRAKARGGAHNTGVGVGVGVGGAGGALTGAESVMGTSSMGGRGGARGGPGYSRLLSEQHSEDLSHVHGAADVDSGGHRAPFTDYDDSDGDGDGGGEVSVALPPGQLRKGAKML